MDPCDQSQHVCCRDRANSSGDEPSAAVWAQIRDEGSQTQTEQMTFRINSSGPLWKNVGVFITLQQIYEMDSVVDLHIIGCWAIGVFFICNSTMGLCVGINRTAEVIHDVGQQMSGFMFLWWWIKVSSGCEQRAAELNTCFMMLMVAVSASSSSSLWVL